MRTSLKGHQLPEDYMEAVGLASKLQMKFTRCGTCSRHLATPEAASTSNGWAETQISGTCEPCWNETFKDD